MTPDFGKIRSSRVISTDQVSIVYTAQGHGGPALLFIHGGFADRSFWAAQFPSFQKKHRVIALDLAGHGESGQNRVHWDIFAFAQDVRAVMEKERIEKAVLIGNSMGGPVAIEAAAILGDRILGIVAVDTLQVLRQGSSEDFFQKRAQEFRQDFSGTMKKMVGLLFHPNTYPALYDQVEQAMLRSYAPMAPALMESFAGYRLTDSLAKINCPIRCINGDLFPTQTAENRAVYPDFDAVILPETGHYPMLENPLLFNRHLALIVQDISNSVHQK